MITNGTKHTISYAGCPFGRFAYGLVATDRPDAALTGHAMSGCSPGVEKWPAGVSRTFFAVTLPIRSDSHTVPPGKYIAVVRFPDKSEVRTSVTVGS